MIITTTPSVEGRQIVEYKGIVFGEVVSGVNFLKDFAAGMRNFFGGRSGSYEEELLAARTQAIQEMESRAAASRSCSIAWRCWSRRVSTSSKRTFSASTRWAACWMISSGGHGRQRRGGRGRGLRGAGG